jgi:hypothetical protein
MLPEGFAADLGVIRVDHSRPGCFGHSEQAARGAGVGPNISGEKIEQVACGNLGKEGVPGSSGGGVIAGQRLAAGWKRISVPGAENDNFSDQRVSENFLQEIFIAGTGAPGNHDGDHGYPRKKVKFPAHGAGLPGMELRPKTAVLVIKLAWIRLSSNNLCRLDSEQHPLQDFYL